MTEPRALDVHAVLVVLAGVVQPVGGDPVDRQALVGRALDGPLDRAAIAVLGASFKAGTSAVRHSPALPLAGRLHQAGARTVIYEPEAIT